MEADGLAFQLSRNNNERASPNKGGHCSERVNTLTQKPDSMPGSHAGRDRPVVRFKVRTEPDMNNSVNQIIEPSDRAEPGHSSENPTRTVATGAPGSGSAGGGPPGNSRGRPGQKRA